MINRINFPNIILLFCFFSPYLGLTPIAYGLIIINIGLIINKRFRLVIYDYFILFLFFLFLSFKFYQVNFLVFDALTRYYFGVIIIYYFIKLNNLKLKVENLILLLFGAVIIEAFLINVFINPFEYLPNYPKSVFEFGISSHYTKFMGFYQRPYSIGMNASISSTIICGLLLYRAMLIKEKQIEASYQIEILGFFSVLLFASGVGISLYFFYLLYRSNLLTYKRLLLAISIILILFVNYDKIIGLYSEDSIFQKVSSAYIEFLLNYKIDQVDNVVQILKEKNNSILIGQMFNHKSEVIIQSDFAWNDFLQCLGLFGLITYFLFIINKINIINFLPVFLLLIGAFHYGGVFTIAGQIILSFLLLYPRKTS
jgi:hypothetical protein